MATSGSTLWHMTRDELIDAALRKLTVLPEGVSSSSAQKASAALALNGLISSFQSLGLLLWKRTEKTIPFVVGQTEYILGEGQAIDTPYPLKVLQAIVEYSSGAQVDMELVPHYNYNLLPKNATGIPIKGSYQPKNDVGVFYIWPAPDTSAAANNNLILTYNEPLDVFTSGTETADFPREWTLALIYGLADLLSDEYGLPLEDRQVMNKKAAKWLDAAISSAGEDSPMFLFPNWG